MLNNSRISENQVKEKMSNQRLKDFIDKQNDYLNKC